MYKKMHIFRIRPEQDLLKGIGNFCEKNKIRSAVVLQIIGSLETAQLGFLKKLPGKYITKEYKGPLEIVCAQGTIATKGDEVIPHIHMMVSTEKGAIGGHLSLGCTVFSTAEVVIGELWTQVEREKDNHTGLNELKE
ncbi:MAG: DNA-binding protein [Candidatus Aenigmarchaeota archaeon]|nr:DNA-binding protein [Candidatus Aenigmarchaeota archaeon]